MTIYRLILFVDGHWFAHDFNEENLLPAMEARGFTFVKLNDNERHRQELQGQPKFKGVNGPMWGGTKDGQPIIRYETPEAYAELSK